MIGQSAIDEKVSGARTRLPTCFAGAFPMALCIVFGPITAKVASAERVAHLAEVSALVDPDGRTVVYRVTGELFFASSNDPVGRFKCATPTRVSIHT